MIYANSASNSSAISSPIPSPLQWWKHSTVQTLRVFDEARATPINADEDTSPGVTMHNTKVFEVDSMPRAVAIPLAVARDPHQRNADRLDSAAQAALEMLRTAGSVLLADYLDSETVCSRIERTLSEMRTPGWPEWHRLCQWLCFFYSGDLPERPRRPSRFPRMVSALRQITHKPQPALVELLRQSRDRGQQPRAVPSGSFMALARKLREVLALVNNMARSLFLPRKLTLLSLASERPAMVILMHGAHESPHTGPARAQWMPALKDAGTAVLVEDAVLPLYPLATIIRLGMEGARLAMAWSRLAAVPPRKPQQCTTAGRYPTTPLDLLDSDELPCKAKVKWVENLRDPAPKSSVEQPRHATCAA